MRNEARDEAENMLHKASAYAKEETGITVDVNDDDITNANSVALIPGKFKPPHRGHLDMVKHILLMRYLEIYL